MRFILATPDLYDPDPSSRYHEEIERRIKEYERYLEAIRTVLPPSAYTFATTVPFRRDRSLYDAWVESLTISEPSSGERSQIRYAEIRVRLLGAWHLWIH